PEQVKSAATGNHSILALSNDRQLAAARSCIRCGCGTDHTGQSSNLRDRASSTMQVIVNKI
ncbi:hypothetical protein MJL30_31930, partial [Salmonella enterica subsp. enterica serovar Anatum]|nr:hypothetical protein [Salmonella enterica subsp. enterica serovar Anatum]